MFIALSLTVAVSACGGGTVAEDVDVPAGPEDPVVSTQPAAPGTAAPPQVQRATPPPDEPAEQPKREPPRSEVPAELVGTWDGDGVTISFSRSGDVTVRDKRDGGADPGTVVVDGSSMTLYLSSGVMAISHWEITRFEAGYGYEFFSLSLDGTSYVRDVPK